MWATDTTLPYNSSSYKFKKGPKGHICELESVH